ncbi:MAG: elongation factor P maturation arginine rhamnosyltransferase EarP [Hydrogenophilaceae bacterium]|nr:elongation factor P maturation arginine rhamnosyltransferase EarP [Hydrogenophilaceae bacterium]
MKTRWDIFCTVIDNYGDIGIAWRLARQLTEEFNQYVRLWVDDLESFQRLEPRIDAYNPSQMVCGVEVCQWTEPLPDIAPAQVVIEALACRLPDAYLEKMAAMPIKPVWINLEYLSAEDWVEKCHGLSSPHPRLPLIQTFFIPGFGPGTGGLLGSPRHHEKLDVWRRQTGERARFLSGMGIESLPDQALTVSLFAYDNPAIAGLLDALAAFTRPACLIVPEGKASSRVAAWLGLGELRPRQPANRGMLAVHPIPFLYQDQYDHLLWACDLNCVRGEDSFVQAQWASRPLIWQPYVQEDGAHWKKLQAFLSLYRQGLEPETFDLLASAWQLWNAGERGKPEIWHDYLGKLPELNLHAGYWQSRIKSWPNLANELFKFVKARI